MKAARLAREEFICYDTESENEEGPSGPEVRFETKAPTKEDEQEMADINDEIEIERRYGIGSTNSKNKKLKSKRKSASITPPKMKREGGTEKGWTNEAIRSTTCTQRGYAENCERRQPSKKPC